MRALGIGVWVVGAFLVASCGGGNLASNLVKLPEFDPSGQMRCGATKSQTRPLIIEWPGPERADLDAELRGGGLVAVKYAGCEMNVLRGCRAAGSYRWVSTQREQEGVVMDDADKLFAQMPMAGPQLEAHLSQGQTLRVSTTIVGKYVADRPSVRLEELQGEECKEATHVVIGVTAGAFQLYAQGKANVGGSAGPFGGGESSANREKLHQAGTDASCATSKRADANPPDDCQALLRLEVEPLKCPAGASFVDGKGCVAAASAPDAPGASAPYKVLAGDPIDFPFASMVHDAEGGILAAYAKKPHDARWDCDSAKDLRAVDDMQRDKIAYLGASPDAMVGFAHFRIFAPQPGGGANVFGAGAFVLPDGRVKWAIEHGSEEKPGAGAVSIASLPSGVRDAVGHLVGSLTKGCAPALVDESDFAALPLPGEQRDKFRRMVTRMSETLPASCKAVSDASSELRVEMRQMGAVLAGSGKTAAVFLNATTPAGRVCLADFHAEAIDK